MPLLTSVLLASEEELAPLFAPAPVIGLIAALIFLMMGLVTFAYRDVANRHSQKSGGHPGERHDENHTADHGAGH